jgi:phage gpG-like protein
MAGIVIRASLQGVELAVRELEGIAARGKDLTPLMGRIGAVILRSVDQNFQAGGRPTKWKARSASTVAGMVGEFQRRAMATKRYQSARTEKTRAGILGRAATRATGNQVLIESGKLRQSMTMEVGPNGVRVGTADKRGPIHQFGGTIHVPALHAQPGRALRWNGVNGTVFARHTRAHDVTIPARPFLLVQPEDDEKIAALTLEYLAGGGEHA